ncbi:hypothetical protein [Streptomyces sp. NPDC002785]|uniref:hypothetical protein n=1 Tax=Streptomyces sp. NPDC002785 TaxID=3154543 RepID=UPI003316A71A
MERRRLLAVVVALAAASGCSNSDDDKPGPSGVPPADGARQAVVAYVDALNARSIPALMKVGDVKDEKWSRHEAAEILAEKGGREWKIKDVQIDHDMGPDTGSARLVAEDKSGKPMRDTFTVTRQQGTWYLVVFTHQPTGSGKETASTDEPNS